MHCCLPTFTPILDCCVLGRPHTGSFQEDATPGQVRRIRATMGQGAPYSPLEISGRAPCDIVSLAFPRMSKTALLRPPPDVLRLAFPGLRRGETLERPFFRKTCPVIFNSFPFYWTLFLVNFFASRCPPLSLKRTNAACARGELPQLLYCTVLYRIAPQTHGSLKSPPWMLSIPNTSA